ncbi:sugar ABC transporter permease [Paenibacillus sp. MY03]|jgi:putative aldouronate transport system permease protein|uniref:Sugar ABC transporter permease n=1 Tax=Paenibacillus agaridevorans TaxID=171404 RepID=A0A2R5F0V7_9BACL|nr:MULTISPECIES: carbohydrate ABC transporter permease [Paenibacillus]OUS77073.1 sugar ABC transporter permease [Paenibacillus sp. MY03]GBG09264.1 sugar ABC transporter permease [Paenibacillus agaridevorans]
MLNSRSFGERLFDSLNALLMIALMAVTLYPFLYVLFASFSSPAELMQHRGLLLAPEGFSLQAYKLVLADPMIASGYFNTLFYVIIGTALNILLTSFAAYGLSRRGTLLGNKVMFAIVFTMFFSGGLIPHYLIIKNLHLFDTRWVMILPTAISTWNLLVMRTSFQQVPVALEESARIDGANDFTILFRIFLPVSLPILAVMTLFYGVQHWNSYLDAMIYLRDRELYPLQLILQEILIANSTDQMMTTVSDFDKGLVQETIKYATIIVATVPILLLYPFLQRYFVKGVMLGAIKE